MRTRTTVTAGMAALTALALAAVTACSSSSSSSSSASPSVSATSSSSNPLSQGGAASTVVVGSANFPESELLAEVYILALQAKGIKVTPKLNIGSREVYYPQVEKGTISIMPEYNGTLLTVAVDKTSTAKTTAQVQAALAAKLPSTLEVLNPASAQDSDSVTVTAATAAKYHLKTIGDLKSLAASFSFGGPPEFKTRTDGLTGLKATYGLTFKSFVPLDTSGPITLAALNVIPLVYKSAMNATITDTLNAISAKLTTDALLQMDNAVITLHADYATVAAAFLKAAGLT